MPALLSDTECVLNWFPDSIDREEILALLNWVNQRAAEALAHAVEIHWQGQIANTIHGFFVTALDRPFVTLTFNVRTDRPEIGCCGLANKGAVIVWHDNHTEGDTRRQLASPGELIELLISPETSGPSYSQWAMAVLKDYLRERNRTWPQIDPSSIREGINRMHKAICKAMESAKPVAELRDQLALALVGDRNLVDFLGCLSAHRLLVERHLVKRLLDDHRLASRLWAVCADSHARLAPLLLAALPYLGPVDAKASLLLRRLGIGKNLSKRLRGLPADRIAKLPEAVEKCRDIDFTVSFFRHLAMAWPQLPAVEAHFEGSRLHFLFALCKRLASLDRWARQGRFGLPKRTVYAICPYQPNDKPLDPDAVNGPDASLVSLDNLRRVLNAVTKSLVLATCRPDLEKITANLDHVMDWLSHAHGEIHIPEGISLEGLQARADTWVENADLSRIPELTWSCALLAHAEAWRRNQAAISTRFRIIPLASTESLRDETRAMKHCVAPAYWGPAAEGWTRLFSVEKDSIKYATIELAFQHHWECIQIKGPNNLERIHVLRKHDDDLGRLVRDLVRFYNLKQPAIYPNLLGKPIRPVKTDPSEIDIPRLLRGGAERIAEADVSLDIQAN